MNKVNRNSLKYQFKLLVVSSFIALIVTFFGIRLMSKTIDFSFQERQHSLPLERVNNELNKITVNKTVLITNIETAMNAAGTIDDSLFMVEKLLIRLTSYGFLIDNADKSYTRLLQAQKYLNEIPSNALTADEVNAVKEHVTWSINESKPFGEGVLALGGLISIIVSVLVFVSVGGVIGMVFRLQSKTVPPLEAVIKELEFIAKGDLTVNITTDADADGEVGRMQTSLKHMVTNIQKIILSINEVSIELASEVNTSSLITQDTLAGVKQQKSETELVSSSIREMSLAINEVASSASNAALSASESNDAAKIGQEIVESAVSSIKNLSHEVDKSVDAIERIEEGSTKIVSVVKIITDITAQTNLLALNAAIEAAHAGEFGRGFAVVADQVRLLADQTEKSTMEIRNMVEELRGATVDAVSIMNKSKEQASTSVEQSSKTGEVIDEIAGAVSNITMMNEQIASAAEEQNVVTAEITKHSEVITDIAEKAELGADKISSVNENILRLSKELNKSVSAFEI
jgi:Methyl-accepting chemotaxis protein